MTINIKIRQFRPEDFAGVMALVQTCYGDAAEPPEWWQWRHFELNPKDSTMFVAVHEDRIMGMRPMALFDYFLQGKPLRGALFSAVMVHPDYRRMGIFSRLVKACMEEAWRRGATFVNTMPNDVSYMGFMKLGWIDPGERTLLIRPINLQAIGKQKIPPAWLGAPLGFMAQCLFQLNSPRRRQYKTTVAPVPAFGPEAEDLSRQIGTGYDGLILHRTQRGLNWRYQIHPWNRYERFEARSLKGNLKGYAVTNLSTQLGLEVGFIVDLLGADDETRKALIQGALHSLRNQGAQICAAVMTSPELLAELRTQGFFALPRRLSLKNFYTVYQPHPDHTKSFDILRSIAHWYQTLGDWDGI
jgi:GNAT superfamily N-acetyltransferase